MKGLLSKIKKLFPPERHLEPKGKYFRFYDIFEASLFSILLFSIFGYAVLSLNPDYKGIEIDFITVSISLAGFVLIGALFDKGDKKTRNELLGAAKAFIYSTISFIVFYVVAPLSQNSTQYFIFSILVISLVTAPFAFSTGIIKLLRAINFGKY